MGFMKKLKGKVKFEDLNLNNYVLPKEIKQTLFMWLKENQSLFLSDSISITKAQFNENGLYCSYANLNFNTKFPILFHNNDYLTELIVEDNFRKVLHNGFKHI